MKDSCSAPARLLLKAGVLAGAIIVSPAHAADQPTWQRLIGSWKGLTNNHEIEVRSNQDVIFDGLGQGRIGDSVDAGSNVIVNFASTSCLYYVSFDEKGGKTSWFSTHGSGCPAGIFAAGAKEAKVPEKKPPESRTWEHLIGGWNNLETGYHIEVRRNRDALFSTLGQGRIADSSEFNSNIVINFGTKSCHYMLTYESGGEKNSLVATHEADCPAGIYIKFGDQPK